MLESHKILFEKMMMSIEESIINIEIPSFDPKLTFQNYYRWRKNNQTVLKSLWNIEFWPSITPYSINIWSRMLRNTLSIEKINELLKIWEISQYIVSTEKYGSLDCGRQKPYYRIYIAMRKTWLKSLDSPR